MPQNPDSEVERYRHQVATALHDGPQQLLISIGMRLQMLATDVPAEFEAEVSEIARQAVLIGEQLRDLAAGNDDQV